MPHTSVNINHTIFTKIKYLSHVININTLYTTYSVDLRERLEVRSGMP